MFMVDLEEFMGSPARVAWVREPGIALYVRKALPHRLERGIHLELANMHADHPGRGALTALLELLEPRLGLLVENIQNPRLVGYLERRGYAIDRSEIIPSAYRPQVPG